MTGRRFISQPILTIVTLWLFFAGIGTLQAAPVAPSGQAPVVTSFTYSSEPVGADGKWKVYFYWTVSDPDSSVSSLLCQVDTNRLDGTTTPEYKGPCSVSGETNPDFTYTYSQGGSYSVSLTVTDKNGNRASKNLSISSTTNTAPVIRSFSANPTTATSVPATISFSWDLYDANGDALQCTFLPDLYTDSGQVVQNPCSQTTTITYTYTQNGTYTAALIVTDGKSPDVMSTVVLEIAVAADPQAPVITSFTATPSSSTTLPVAVTFAWSLSDANGDVLACTLMPDPLYTSVKIVKDPCPKTGTATYTYAAMGTYAPALIVTDKTTGEVTQQVTVEAGADFALALKTAKVTLEPGGDATVRVLVRQANLDTPVTLSLRGAVAGMTGTFDPTAVEADTSILTLHADTTVAAGTYALYVDGSATDNGSPLTHSTLPLMVEIPYSAPQITMFGVTPDPTPLGEETEFRFSFTAVAGVTYACAMDTGDGSGSVAISCAESYRHTYAATGLYTTLLTIEDTTHQVKTTAGAGIEVTAASEGNHPPVVSSFTATPASGELNNGAFGTIFRWTATDPDGDAMLCTVNAGDGSAPVSGLPCAHPYGYTYKTAGTFTATVTASDMDGLSGSATTTVTVAGEAASNASPQISDFTATPSSGTLVDGQLAVTFTWTTTDADTLSCTLDADAGLGPQTLDGVDCAQGSYTYVYTRDEIEEELGGYTGEWNYTNTPELMVYDAQGASASATTTIEMTAPAIAPTILASEPMDEAKNLPTNTKIYLAFSDEMEQWSTEASFSLTALDGTSISGGFTWLSSSELEFTPTLPLPDNASYTVTVSEYATTISGLPFAAPFSLNFTTVSAPTVTETSPWNRKSYVGIKRPIRLVFDQSMDTASVETAFGMTAENGSQVSGNFEWSADTKTVYFTPTSPLALETTYTVAVSAGTSTETGYSLAPYTLAFTTSTEATNFEAMGEALDLVNAKLTELNYIETVDDLKELQAYIATLDAFGASFIDEAHLCILATFKNGIEYSYCDQPTPEEEASESASAKTASTSTESLAVAVPSAAASADAAPAATASATASGDVNKVTTPSYTLPDSKTVYLGEAYLGYEHSSPIPSIEGWLKEEGYDPKIIDPTVETLRQMRTLPSQSIGGLYLNGHGGYGDYLYLSATDEDGNPIYISTKSGMTLQTNTPVPNPRTEASLAAYKDDLEVGRLSVMSIEDRAEDDHQVVAYFSITAEYGIPYYFKGKFANHSWLYINACTSINLYDSFKTATDSALFTFMGHSKVSNVYRANNAARSFFSGMLGKEYHNPKVTEATYTPPARPFWVSGVLSNDMYGAADVTAAYQEKSVLLEATNKSRALLRPTISHAEMNVDTSNNTPLALIYGHFGTTDINEVDIYLDGNELALATTGTALGSAADTVPLPYTTMADYETLPGSTYIDVIQVELPKGVPCGILQIVVNEVKSNEVPLTCWDGTASYEADISDVYYYPEEGDVMTVGALTQSVSCNFQMTLDVHGSRSKSPWETIEGVSTFSGYNDDTCTYTYAGSLIVLRELDGEDICDPSNLDPGESCEIVTQERIYNFLTDGGTMPLGSSAGYPYMSIHYYMGSTRTAIRWHMTGLEPGDPFPSLLNEKDKIRIETTTYITTYSCDAEGNVHEEAGTLIDPPLEQAVGFYFDNLYTDSPVEGGMKTPITADYSIKAIKKDDGARDDVSYKVSIPGMAAQNAPTDETPR